MEEGNQFIRLPIGARKAKGSEVYRITQVASAARRAYRGRKVRFFTLPVNDPDPFLDGAMTGPVVKIYNIKEGGGVGSTGPLPSTFLVVGDEVVVFKQNGLNLCSEIPLGFV